MEGKIIQQSLSYRRGLVLGLTMAEIMILLVFCLLIAMATFLKAEQTRRMAAEQQVRAEQTKGAADRKLVAVLKDVPALYERVLGAAGSRDNSAINEYWRELVESREFVAELKTGGLSENQLRQQLVDAAALKSRGIDVETAMRDVDVVGSIQRVMPLAGDATASPQSIADAIERGLNHDRDNEGAAGHQWPPIINLSEAAGYYFKTGSAELSPEFRANLVGVTSQQIATLIKQFDVDVIEVVGHTDEQPLSTRISNLDRDLVSVLKNQTGVAGLLPADNAGLGLARAVSVVSVLQQVPSLAGYKLIPLSGAQLVNNDETLDVTGVPADIPARRRIEIRLRKSSRYISAADTPRRLQLH
jgi:outer membrane protein OmpA-like peptidoglycan-associated protein